MRWFWKDKQKSSPELEAIQQVKEQVKEQNSIFEEQYKLLGEQVTKLSRLQYKTSKDMQEKVGSLHESVSLLIKNQEDMAADKEQEMVRLEMKIEKMTNSLIRRLDDYDIVSSRLTGEDQEAWNKVLNQWSHEILEQLNDVGIHEIQVLGSSFDPIVAEAIAAISKKEAEMKYPHFSVQEASPYQIVEVLQRGFQWKNGSLLRKAKVITLKMEDFYGE